MWPETRPMPLGAWGRLTLRVKNMRRCCYGDKTGACKAGCCRSVPLKVDLEILGLVLRGTCGGLLRMSTYKGKGADREVGVQLRCNKNFGSSKSFSLEVGRSEEPVAPRGLTSDRADLCS